MKNLRFKVGDHAINISKHDPRFTNLSAGREVVVRLVGPFKAGDRPVAGCIPLIKGFDYVVDYDGGAAAVNDESLIPLNGDDEQFRREQDQELADRFVIRGLPPRIEARVREHLPKLKADFDALIDKHIAELTAALLLDQFLQERSA